MTTRLLFAAALTFALAACSKDKPASGAPEGATATKAAPATGAATGAAAPAGNPGEHPVIAQVGGEAATVFRTRCATCHGLAGKGDGAAAQALNPKPRSFEDAAWQATIDDNHVKTVIVKGGTAVGKSPLMAPNPDLEGKDATLNDLVKIVRGMAKK